MKELLLQQQEQQRQQQEQQQQSQQMLAHFMTALLQHKGPIPNELPAALEGADRPVGPEQSMISLLYQHDPPASPPAMPVYSDAPSAASRYASPIHCHIHR